MRDKCISLLNNRRYKFDVEHELRVLFHFTFLVSSRIFGVGLSPRKSLKHFPFAIFVINHKMEIFVSIGRYSFTVERQKDLVCLGIRHRYKLNRNIMAILRNNIYTLVCNIFRGFTFSQENIGVGSSLLCCNISPILIQDFFVFRFINELSCRLHSISQLSIYRFNLLQSL